MQNSPLDSSPSSSNALISCPRSLVLASGRVARRIVGLVTSTTVAICWRLWALTLVLFYWLRANWSTLLQTFSFVATALFTGLLWKVTSDYTGFTRQIFQSQHEKYVYDVLGKKAFEVEFLPRPPILDVRNVRLQVRIKNLTVLNFDNVHVRVFASVRDRRTGQLTTLFVFEPFVDKPLDGEALMQIEDKQGDMAFHLNQAGVLTQSGLLRSRFEIATFFVHVEAVSPGGVLWRINTEQ